MNDLGIIRMQKYPNKPTNRKKVGHNLLFLEASKDESLMTQQSRAVSQKMKD